MVSWVQARSSHNCDTQRGSWPSPCGCPRGVPTRLVDLGSGGGLPGLVVAVEWADATLDLLEANGRRAAFLRRAVERLGLDHRVTVVEERAEVCGRVPGLRAGFDGVLARSFGRPAVLAECAAPLLKVGGWLLVSEPPLANDDQADRWPVDPLRQFGLEPSDSSMRPSSTGSWSNRNSAPTASPPKRRPGEEAPVLNLPPRVRIDQPGRLPAVV